MFRPFKICFVFLWRNLFTKVHIEQVPILEEFPTLMHPNTCPMGPCHMLLFGGSVGKTLGWAHKKGGRREGGRVGKTLGWAVF